MEKVIKFGIIFTLFVVSIIFVYFFIPESSYQYGNNGKLIINEIMSSNTKTFKDSQNNYYDWIELYNGYDFDINLEGYHLADKEFETKIWEFPNVVIKKKSYLLIFASGKDTCNESTCHTNFKLSSNGEVITLSDKDDSIISRIKYERTKSDTSYGYMKNKYVYFYEPTPGKKNKGSTTRNPIISEKKTITVNITEYMTSNTRTVTDQDGNYSDFIELYNYGDSDINLEGCYISDDISNVTKYMFPNIVIKSKQYLVVYASNKNKYNESEIHTNFKLGNTDNFIVLSNTDSSLIDKAKIVELNDNISYGIKDNKWCFFTSATPGVENNTKCFDKLG